MSRKRKSEEVSSTNETSSKSQNSGSTAKANVSIAKAAVLIRRGEMETLKEIIDQGRILDINLSISRYSDQTLLTISCEAGSLECVKLLVENNATINTELTQDELLASIIDGANIDILKYLLERGLALDDRRLLMCRGFIDMSASNEMFALLVERITNVNYIYDDTTFLIRASGRGNLAFARLLLERGALHDTITDDFDALRSAAERGHAEIVSLLLNWNKDEAPIAANRVAIALYAASYNDHLDAVRVLVEYGVDQVTLNIALCEAVAGSRPELVTYLLDNGANVNAHNEDMTALVSACAYDGAKLAKLLLTRGADPNLAAPDGGLRPLDAAELQCDVMKVLLEHGADPNLLFAGNSTALLEALRSDDVDDKAALLTVLLEHEADPNKADPETGETPLMIAALAVEVDLVKLLLEHGADVTQADRDGRAVLDMLGRTRKYGPVVELCEQYIECNKPGAKAILK